jgi:pimeloyl-ACP methyl ester carboxylesterase
MVRKLILVGAGPFEEEYAAQLTEIRLGRLTEHERGVVHDLQLSLNDPNLRDKLSVFARFGQLMSKADSFDVVQERGSAIEYHPDTYERVWSEAKELRRSGELLRMGERIQCPVVAIHGDYDPHPADGVRIPLARVLKDFRFELLPKCGHTPWLERHARDRFYETLKSELI